jgi:preprotein translocase subunit SecB
MEYKILSKFIKDVSFEIPNLETFLYFSDNLSNYEVKVDIQSRVIKNKMIEIDTVLRLENKKKEVKKRAQVEVTHCTIINLDGDIDDKKELEKIILIKVPTEIYPMLFQVFALLIEKSGLPNIKINKEIDFRKLYEQRNVA